MPKSESLVETLALERIEVNLFRGLAPRNDGPRIFGGLVIAQALLAAYGTVEKSLCHSIHCYFLRPGDPTIPILYEVDRARDGRSFTSRRVTAIQHGEQIFNLAGSFQHPEAGLEHQDPMPDEPSPEQLSDETQLRARLTANLPPLTADKDRPLLTRAGRSGAKLRLCSAGRRPWRPRLTRSPTASTGSRRRSTASGPSPSPSTSS